MGGSWGDGLAESRGGTTGFKIEINFGGITPPVHLAESYTVESNQCLTTRNAFRKAEIPRHFLEK